MSEKKNFFWNKDIKFHFGNTINWGKIVPLYEEKGTSLKEALDMYKLALDQLGTIMVTELVETAKDTDEFGTEFIEKEQKVIYSEGFKNTLKTLKKYGYMALDVKREYEGPGMPGIVHMINLEMMARADPAFMISYSFYSAVAKTLEQFATEELKEKYIPKLVSGECAGSMAMTESEAGTYVGGIVTKAEKNDNNWELSGQKIFITNGDAELSIVLARSDPDSKGLKGLSMFLVPRFIEKEDKKVNNFRIGRLEHKMGIRGSSTAELNYEKTIGYLVGKEGEGMKQMFHLMNKERLAVAAQSLGLAEVALKTTKEYAKQRVQFDKPICEHEPVADKLFDMETDVKAMRSLFYKAIEYDDIKAGLEDKLKNFEGEERKELEQEFKKYSYLARELIPLAKYFITERCIEICRDAIHLHGGYGYITETGVERYLRDSVIMPIYEGTSQAQALMAVKDMIKSENPYLELDDNILKSEDSLDKQLVEAKTELNKAIDYLKKETEPYVRLYSESFTRLKACTMMAKFLVEEAKQFPERRIVAERFLQKHMDKDIKVESAAICSGDKSTLDYIEANKK